MTDPTASIRIQRACRAMVSTGSHFATLAALEALNAGGNAFDAGISASAVLNVALPMSCGLGGDAVVLGYVGASRHTFALMSLGAAPSGATPEAFRRLGFAAIPRNGILSATVPALLHAYAALHEAYGSLPLSRLFEPAISLAETGLVVSCQFSRWTANNRDILELDARLKQLYCPHGKPLEPNMVLRQPEIAATYRSFGECGRDWLTKDQWIDPLFEQGRRGLFERKDFSCDPCKWARPISLELCGYTVLTAPLPTQSYLLLQNLALYERAAHRDDLSEGDRLHILSEVYNQTFRQRLEYAGDPEFVEIPISFLSEDNLSFLFSRLDFQFRTPTAYRCHYNKGDTTYFHIVDAKSNAVSWIQSLSLGFGSGISVPGTGLVFSNRLGRSCTLNPDHPNVCAPGKRPVNTIGPYLVLKADKLRYVGGTPGGDGQPQWNSAFLAALLVHGEPLDQCLVRPRMTYFPGSDLIEQDRREELQVDRWIDTETVDVLRARGHQVTKKSKVGGSIRITEIRSDHLLGAEDGREEGLTAGW